MDTYAAAGVVSLESWEYDEAGRLLVYEDRRAEGTVAERSELWTWDTAGRPLSFRSRVQGLDRHLERWTYDDAAACTLDD